MRAVLTGKNELISGISAMKWCFIVYCHIILRFGIATSIIVACQVDLLGVASEKYKNKCKNLLIVLSISAKHA